MKKLILLIAFLLSSFSFAHEGPPFPILVDHVFGNSKISVWADPDTENGTFLIYPESQESQDSKDSKDSPESLIFEVKATPKDQAEPILKSTALTSQIENGKASYTATLPFPTEGLWDVTIQVKNKQNGDILTSATIPVEVTPPGPSKTEFAVYLVPFLLIGAIWIRVILYKRKKTS